MRYLTYSFALALGRRLRKKSFWLILLLTLAALAMTLLPREEASAPVRVGLVLPRSCEELQDLFLERSSGLIEFIPTDPETLERKILTGSWDCGLVGEKDLAKRLAEGEDRNLLTLVTGPGSTVYPIVRETAAACLMELLAPQMARDYLARQGVAPEAVDSAMDYYRENAPRVQVRLETVTGEQVDAPAMAERSLTRLMWGLAAIMLLTWALYLTVDMGRWLSSPAALRLARVRRPTQLLLPQLAAGLIPGAVPGVLLLLGTKSPWSVPALLAFCVTLLGMGLVGSRIRWFWQGIPVLTPFLVLLCLVFEPVIVDVTALFPWLIPVTRWLPVGLYLRGCQGQPLSLLALVGEGAALLLISLALDRGKR